MCVKPFHYSYSRVEWLMEWFEMNQQLGVSHFYMYNGSLSRGVECLLQNYLKEGLVTLLPWKLPLVSKLDIRYHSRAIYYETIVKFHKIPIKW